LILLAFHLLSLEAFPISSSSSFSLHPTFPRPH
jgi:hypothetical protein